MKSVGIIFAVFAVFMAFAGSVLADSVVLVSTDYDGADSLTCGIQEALEALPPGGGTVYVPPGTHMMHRAIMPQPGTRLTGAGRASVIRKSPNFKIALAEDVSKDSTQNYVRVTDSTQLRPGMFFVLMDAKERIGDGGLMGLIHSVDGDKVVLHTVDIRRGSIAGKPWTPQHDYLVARGACLMHIFPLVMKGARGVVISDLAFDGNKDEQKIEGQNFYRGYHGHTIRYSRCLPYLFGAVVERCFIFDAVQVNISLSAACVIVNNEIWGAAQGIHPGAGPNARIVGNRIHDNWESGIFMCMGNHGMIISENHIYRNGTGIDALGTRTSGTEYLRRDGDHYCVIANNVIFENTRAGIGGLQGKEGPEDFVITGNIIYNNHTARAPSSRDISRLRALPAGISLYNAKRCIIAQNRIFDDQDWYVSELHQAAPEGTKSLSVVNRPGVPMCDAVPRQMYPWFMTLQSDAKVASGLRVLSGGGRSYPRVRFGLEEPLECAFPAGTSARRDKTQIWGIIVAGPAARDNLIAHNICLDNRVGGILWQGPGTQVSDNLGPTLRLAESEVLSAQVVFPAIPLPEGESLSADILEK